MKGGVIFVNIFIILMSLYVYFMFGIEIDNAQNDMESYKEWKTVSAEFSCAQEYKAKKKLVGARYKNLKPSERYETVIKYRHYYKYVVDGVTYDFCLRDNSSPTPAHEKINVTYAVEDPSHVYGGSDVKSYKTKFSIARAVIIAIAILLLIGIDTAAIKYEKARKKR